MASSVIEVPRDLPEVVSRALAEDMGSGDITAQWLIASGQQAVASVFVREPAVIAGVPWFEACFRSLDPGVRFTWLVREGEYSQAETRLVEFEGSARALVTGERTALNFLQLLSGTATVTRRYVEQVAGTRCRILDTRKTLPGLRSAQKYATRIGGATNHRHGLYDAVLIKENHLACVGDVAEALARAFSHAPIPIVIEVENLGQLAQALEAGATWVLLDNFSLADIRVAVVETRGRARLEVSGGMDLSEVRAVAEAGVDFISIGALTKHVQAIDLSMRIRA
ncbi:MAG: carboxylating nicotinate-nucleotide diphosphorylase [Gammaproteobacteria bacterium]